MRNGQQNPLGGGVSESGPPPSFNWDLGGASIDTGDGMTLCCAPPEQQDAYGDLQLHSGNSLHVVVRGWAQRTSRGAAELP